MKGTQFKQVYIIFHMYSIIIPAYPHVLFHFHDGEKNISDVCVQHVLDGFN